MKENSVVNEFDSLPVRKLVLRNANSSIIAMLMVLVYNLADTFFISQTNDDLQVAAVSLATPVFLLFMAIGTIFGIGGTSVISRALGGGRKAYAKHVSAFCMWGCVGIGTLLSVLMLTMMDPLLYFLGAGADIWSFVETYLRIVAFCGPFVLIGTCYSNVLRAEGAGNRAMYGMLIGNLLNVILDPLLILGAGWNIAGAAIATVLGNIVGTLYYLIYFWRGKSMLSIAWKDVQECREVIPAVLSIGIPASIGSVLMSVSQIIVNTQMAVYGSMALAGIGVAMKISMVTNTVSLGLAQGVQPLFGYCIGSGNWKRYREILKMSLSYAVGLSIVLTGLSYWFMTELVEIFLSDSEAISYAIDFADILLSTSFLFGLFFVLLCALQAMGAGRASLIINISRQGLIYVPAVFMLQLILGVTGLVWAQPVADILSLLMTVWLYRKECLQRQAVV